MTYEEAKRVGEELLEQNMIGGECDEYENFLCKAIEALEKQIPKRPHTDCSKLSDAWCECGTYIGKPMVYKESKRFCQWCGQAIDWSDEE